MPMCNRVTPSGELIAVPDRGLFWGNRGRLHDPDGNLVRYSTGRAWAICELEFKGRRRPLWAPGRLTELFFLDEATGLAAGHRPCGECRFHRYAAFKQAWARCFPGTPASAAAIDTRLHHDRLLGPGVRRTYRTEARLLPTGTMIDLDGHRWLVDNERLLAWTPGGYGHRRDRPDAEVTVITPQSTVSVLAAGYQPVLHPSAAH
ncbi:MAG: hypothetical protein ACRDZ8_08845 [Acidimicrobiales bacterium]